MTDKNEDIYERIERVEKEIRESQNTAPPAVSHYGILLDQTDDLKIVGGKLDD